MLAQQLVGGYEGARPDIVDVVLEATGFNDLLERLAFAQRIGQQNARIVGDVSAARRAVSAEAIRLGTLSAHANQLAEQALADRNQVAGLRVRLVSQRLAAAQTASAKAGQLAGAKAQVASLTKQLASLQAAQRAAPPPSSSTAGAPQRPVAHGPVSHGFEFPMPKADVSPPAEWSLDDGVDIAAPGGTPELAVCSGTVVLHGIGGFGPSAPVLHCDSPLAGHDYVYYGHAGPGDWTPIGTHVGQGQVISQVGYGIVGISSGPHLEIGFADSSGSPIGPSSCAGDDVAAALRLRGLTRAAPPVTPRRWSRGGPRSRGGAGHAAAASRVTINRAASTSSGGLSTCIGASRSAIHTRNSRDQWPRVLTTQASSPSGSTVA